ncbi:hypothetical protein [Mucilaginibacter sp.]|jgi:hypothetical protein|uniref:hypothetical protein n=1 Tax=Mucilaginibacter sp. TaxID=1882438 RepID=UPI003569B062
MKYTVITPVSPMEYKVLKSKREHGLEKPLATSFIITEVNRVECSTLEEATTVAENIALSIILISND